ncbi:MAG TPA: hypothetical protein VFZ35_01205 [Sphingomicrobium sp.]
MIEDELHSEQIGRFDSRDEAINELRRLATLPWNEAPNQAPCTSWRTCGRNYELVECDVDWRELRRSSVLNVSAKGVEWLVD